MFSALPTPRSVAEAAASAQTPESLPEWNLADLYPATDSPQLAADLAKAEREVAQFGKDYRGRLQSLAEGANASADLGAAVKRYEALQDLLGRLMSFAGLLYSGDTTDPGRAKFYGDVQEKVTSASAQLLFFQLELNRLDDAVLMAAASREPLLRWKPWLEDIRKEKPHELDDKLEELFHEKYISGAAAWNRLFDETIASLRFKVGGEELAIEPVLNLMQDQREETRREAAQAIGQTLKNNLRT
ncbi:MAG: oligoendopeptidase F, partial [Alphaproteobacteria bacterium]|nr:oligoendopeptidase F [Alphaproteobacteria bacterium]